VPLNLPGLLVDVVGANCSLPSAAGGALACAVELTNSGNVRLQSGAVAGAGAAIAMGCVLPELLPARKFICQVEQAVTQADLDAADVDAAHTISIGVSATATPLGSNSSDVQSWDAENVALAPALVRGMSISDTSASPATVTDAGKQDKG
jgi:hypothetical protein